MARKKGSNRKKSGIRIKPKNRGKFKRYCQAHGYGGVNARCIAAAKRSKNAGVRSMARFAAAARKWKH